MRLLTTQEFSEILDVAYNTRGYGMTLGEAIFREALSSNNDVVLELFRYATESGSHIVSWENPLALIKYFIDNFVEEF